MTVLSTSFTIQQFV